MSRIEEKNQVIITMITEEAFDKIQYSFKIKTLGTLE